ncbi:hypothetical protein EON81_15180, partial [bacterium]
MLLTPLLLFVGISAQRPILPQKAPIVKSASFAGEVARSIASIPLPQEKITVNRDNTVTICDRGKTVRVKVTPDHLPTVNEAFIGKDGSIALLRVTPFDSGGYYHQMIRNHGREKEILIKGCKPTLMAYRDAKNYVGSFFEVVGFHEYPASEPTAFAVINGKTKLLGPGSPQKVWGLTEMVVEIPVDADGIPCGRETFNRDVLRVYSKGRTFDLGSYDFIGSAADRTITVWKKPVVARWRAGKWIEAWRLPVGWTPVATNPKGEVLLRNLGSDERSEADWQSAILNQGRMAKLRFTRPPKTGHLLWRETRAFRDDGTILFTAFY